MTVCGTRRASYSQRATNTPTKLRIDTRNKWECRGEAAEKPGRGGERGWVPTPRPRPSRARQPLGRSALGAWAGREEAEEGGERARRVLPKAGRRSSARKAAGGGVRGPGCRQFAGREGKPERTREREKGQEVPYRHRATLPPHPLRSRRSAPTLGARPRRPTWPPRAQLKGGDQQPPPTPSPASLTRGSRGARTRRRADEGSTRLKSRADSRGGGKADDSGAAPPAHAQQHPSGAASLGGFTSAAAATWVWVRMRTVAGPPPTGSRRPFCVAFSSDALRWLSFPSPNLGSGDLPFYRWRVRPSYFLPSLLYRFWFVFLNLPKGVSFFTCIRSDIKSLSYQSLFLIREEI